MPAIGSFGEKLDLLIRQGACFAFDVRLNNPDATPVDLAGAVASAKIRKLHADAAAVVAFTASIVLPNTIKFGLTAAETAAIPAGEKPTAPASQYVWDMEILFPDGCVQSYLYGDVKVKAEATK